MDKTGEGKIALRHQLERKGIHLNPDLIKDINRKGDEKVSALAEVTGIPKHVLDEIGKNFFERLVKEPAGRSIIIMLLEEDLLKAASKS